MNTAEQRLTFHAGLVLAAFALAATFKWVMPFQTTVFIIIAAVSLLGTSATWVRADKHMGSGGIFVLAFITIVSAFVFGALFMTWTATIVFTIAALASNLIGSAWQHEG